MKLQREDRQIEALAWYQRVFGEGAENIIARVKAIAAEAITLAREEGLARADLHMMVEQAGQRRAADAVGALSIALLAYCEARGFSAEHCERNELARVISLAPICRRDANAAAGGD